MIRLSELIERSRQGELLPPMVERCEVIRPIVAMTRMIEYCRARGFRRCPRCSGVDSRTVFCGGLLCVECFRSNDPVFTTWF